MNCIKNNARFIEWEKASRITSMPLLYNKMGYKTNPPSCLQWIHGSHVIEGECDDSDKILVTDQPALPTKECYFSVSPIIDPQWLIMLAMQESVIIQKDESTVWVNSSLYSSVGDFKVSSKPFPGSICSGNGTCYGIPNIPPLTAGLSKPMYSTEKMVQVKPTRIFPIQQGQLRLMGGKGYVRIESNEWEGYIEGIGNTGLFYIRKSGILNFKVNLYRPQVMFLHPYNFVRERLEEGESIISPVVSLLGPGRKVFTVASFSPIKVTLRNGIVDIEPLEDRFPIMITEDSPMSSLKKLYNSMAPIVELNGYSSRRNKIPIGSIRIGCGFIDWITFSKNELLARLYNPGEHNCIAEFKFTGVISEAYQDDHLIEPLYDRVKISLASHYLGIVRIKIKQSLSFLLQSGS